MIAAMLCSNSSSVIGFSFRSYDRRLDTGTTGSPAIARLVVDDCAILKKRHRLTFATALFSTALPPAGLRKPNAQPVCATLRGVHANTCSQDGRRPSRIGHVC